MGNPKMIGVFGAGYVGLITATGFSEIGNLVKCYDIDSQKIDLLKNGLLPFYEQGLEEILNKNIKNKNLVFTQDYKDVVTSSDYIFIAVGTPPNEDGSANLNYVFNCLSQIAKSIDSYKIIIIKSTVPPGTCKQTESFFSEQLKINKKEVPFDIVSNPEFLREGNAIYDFFYPDRIIIGTGNQRVKELMGDLYDYFLSNDFKVVFTDLISSELIKYSSNSFLATKISFINELAILAQKIGANIQDVSKGMGLDKRIGEKFLMAGPGYGGSCFPKDTNALNSFAKQMGVNLQIVNATIKANNYQIQYSVNMIIKRLKHINFKILTVLGLTYKPNTDDIRESPAIYIIKELIQNGAIVKTYCPKGMSKARKLFFNESSVVFCENIYESLKDSEACIIVTDWDEFKNMDLEYASQIMKENNLFDLRNIFYSNSKIKKLFSYYGLGVADNKKEVLI